MAFYTDSVLSFDLLKTAIETACQSNGWTLSNGILSKSGCYFKLTAFLTYLLLKGGTSQNESTLIESVQDGVQIKEFSGEASIFPLKYDIHIFNNPDEVYVIVNYNDDCYQQLSFGKSNIQGIGLGAWLTGSVSITDKSTVPKLYLNLSKESFHFVPYTSFPTYPTFTVGLFLGTGQYTYSGPTSYIYTSLDSIGWKYVHSSAANAGGLNACSGDYVSGLITALPNLLNQATVLLPIKAVIAREFGGLTIAANLKNSRLVRLDNHQPEELVTFGSEQWKVYPCYKRNVTQRNSSGSESGYHSGTFGFAIKYTGA